jgi:RNA polymerase primary sigma factor
MKATTEKLLRAARRGNADARREIAASKLRLVRAIASRYRTMGVPVEDLVQEGTVGLVEAIERYDPRRGDFDTFAAATTSSCSARADAGAHRRGSSAA